MEKTLADSVQEVIDVLLLAQSQAWKVKQTMRERRITFPLEYSYFEDDISKMICKLRLMKKVAERQRQ
jgi:hypothetical protein